MIIMARITTVEYDKSISLGIITKSINQITKFVNIYKLDVIKNNENNSNNPIWICREYTEVIFIKSSLVSLR
jgi:hypothetical protein